MGVVLRSLEIGPLLPPSELFILVISVCTVLSSSYTKSTIQRCAILLLALVYT